jgi:hypothetical protein
LDHGHAELIEERIAALKASIAEGDPREAAIRALMYIGMAGSGADERMFNTLRQMRAENGDLTLQAFKRIVREQHFKLRLDLEGSLAAIPKMLSADPARRPRILEMLHRIVRATGEVTGERAERLAQVEKLFGMDRPTAAPGKAISKAHRRPAESRIRHRAAKHS